MEQKKTCKYCGDELLYDPGTDSWACENCEDVVLKKYSSKYVRKITRSKPYQFFFGPKDFDVITRKASKQFWKAIKRGLLGAGLIIAFFLYFSHSRGLLCCLPWALILSLMGLISLVRAKRYFKKLKPPEDEKRSKRYRLSLHWIFPNYVVVFCVFMLIFLALIDIYTLGEVEKGNLLLDFFHKSLVLSWILRNHPYILPVLLWYAATRSMTHAYREAFEAGHRLSIRRHDSRLLSREKAEKWDKKLLLIFSKGIGHMSMIKTIGYTLLYVLYFILSVYLFQQGKREDFMFGLFSGYRIVWFQMCFLIMTFVAMSWVTDYIIKKKYPTTVFGTLGRISLKMKHTSTSKKGKAGKKDNSKDNQEQIEGKSKVKRKSK